MFLLQLSRELKKDFILSPQKLTTWTYEPLLGGGADLGGAAYHSTHYGTYLKIVDYLSAEKPEPEKQYFKVKSHVRITV